MSYVFTPCSRRFALVLFLSLLATPRLSSQTTAEWTTMWTAAKNNGANVPRHVASGGRGHYVMSSELEVLRTTDAGATWATIHQSPDQFAWGHTVVAQPAPNAIVVVTDSVDRMVEPDRTFSNIISSSDGGVTWIESPRWNGRITSVSMIDAQRGIASLIAPADANDSLLLTNDGGMTWRGVGVPGGARYPYEVMAVGMSSWYVHAYDLASKRPGLFRTTDGGASWKSGSIPDNINVFCARDESSIWAAGSAKVAGTDAYNDVVLHSSDGGATWTSMLDEVLATSPGVFSLSFTDDDNGIAGGARGQFYRTSDGGQTWEMEWMPSERLAEYSSARDLASGVTDESIAVTGNLGVVGYHGRRTLIMPEILTPKSSYTPIPLEATITWSSVAGATAYDVQVADTVYGFEYVSHRYFDVPFFERKNIADTSVTLTLDPHKLYVIRVRAHNDQMTGGWSMREYVQSVGDAKTLAFPIITHPLHESVNQPLALDLTWTDVPDATGYDFRVAYEPTFLFTHVDGENHQGTTAHLTELRPNSEHWVRLRARDKDGVTSEYIMIMFKTAAVASADGDVSIEYTASLRPNVAHDATSLRLSLARECDLRVDIVRATGELIANVLRDRVDAGQHELPIDVASLASGTYFVRISIGDDVTSMPLVIAR